MSLKLAIDAFVSYTLEVKKQQNPYRIKYKGNFIKTRSGKSVWRTLGFAKSALRNHVANTLAEHRIYGETDKIYDELVKIVEFVEMTPLPQERKRLS